MNGAALGDEFSTAVILFHEAVGRRLGISAVDHKALGQIQRDGPLTAGVIAERLALTPGAVTALVDRLENKDYVERTPDPSDRRRTLIHAVAAPSLSEAFGDLQREASVFAERFSEEDWRVIIDYLVGMTDIMQRQTRRLTERE